VNRPEVANLKAVAGVGLATVSQATKHFRSFRTGVEKHRALNGRGVDEGAKHKWV
jgi:hypothetical protein